MRFGSPPGLRRAARARGTAAFRAWVARSDDRRLERTLGTRGGLRLLFGALERQLAHAGGLTGEVTFLLRASDGAVRPWTVAADGTGARVGAGPDPRLTVRMGLADLVRIAGGDLDPGDALLTGRLDLEGDFALATRLGELLDRY